MTDLSKTFVDCHFHVFPAGVAHAQARYVPAYNAPLAAWRQVAEPLGVARGVLVQPSFLGTDNSRLLQELAGAAPSLRGVVVVSPDTAPAELARLDAGGVRGIRLNLAGLSHDIAAWTGAHRFWDALLALGWHVELHTDLGALPATLAQLPAALPLVVDHMGRPDSVAGTDATVRALVRRARQTSVHVKLSGAYRLAGRDARALARLWRGELGLHSLLWGSDWPCTNHESEANYPALLDTLYDWVGNEAAPAILVDNPARLYWAS